MDNQLDELLRELKEQSKKENGGRPPTEDEIAKCKKLQECDKRKLDVRKMARRVRKRLNKIDPASEEGIQATEELERYKEAMAIMERTIAHYGECAVLNCSKHIPPTNASSRSETDASSCAEMDTTTLEEVRSRPPRHQ
ncbi:hypothetical protein AVEN_273123-1 [Araneus ventricosus]|uniref:Uncharacterized protein n=1 Tax=Araneus ventricosus TaxID=182803 RepID=A0A4Y2WNY6_ARAVE|nr:hypothetical protein AVEN_224347-1 [Araneus ventricosus]GBO37657.1 hypothetical protein AVEN_175013-1 [Araneus ventricosus]GBO37730.1 hypothetical protein AVEN_269182-1 [Araneus ventricosus]GBO37743.1 hypothetical protein AVEN_273123-1 [Araneus ventricosus]